MSSIDESKEFVPLNIAVLTISDTRSLADDKSGTTLAERLFLVPPHLHRAGAGLPARAAPRGGVEPLFEKRMDGFSIAFHMLSYAKIGTSTVQSRATAGVAGATFIFCLPGSPGACRDGWDGILAAQLDYRTRPCNFVEIMPRLDEHLRRPKAKGASA